MTTRRLILHMSVSLDGFVAHSDGNIDWLTPTGGVDHGDRRHRANLEMFGEIGLIMMGRRACEQMAPAWSSSDSPMAQVINALPKVIYSQTLAEVDWSNTRISRAAIADEVPALKQEPGKDIVVFGGGHFGHSLIRERLVDELRQIARQAIGLGLSTDELHELLSEALHGVEQPVSTSGNQEQTS